ncbi:hypothetical protein LX36DRAFT_689152 [Colletotrichum falcatum]|nr:hypothetical protein LX36DRAFT_689152 [Colletotrichum falcatum]
MAIPISFFNLVSELTSYYQFLTQICLPPEVIQHPPEGGWEHITPEFYIPYIRRTKEDDWDPWQIYGNATPLDFTSETVLDLPSKYANESLFEPNEGSILDILPHEALDEEDWRRFQTYTFREFFSMAKEMFRKFEMIAVDRNHVHCTSPDVPEAQIYREEGVFTKRYDRGR